MSKSKHMFVEGDYILTIDPLMVDKVSSFEGSYYFFLSDGSAHVVDKKHTRTVDKLLELVKPNFEVVNFGEEKTEAVVDYKFCQGCATHCFVLAFPDYENYSKTWDLFEEYKQIQVSHGGHLVIWIEFPLYYDSYQVNKDFILTVLGEPANG